MLFTLLNGGLSGTVFAAAEEAETGIVSVFEGIRTHKGENVDKIEIAREVFTSSFTVEGKNQNCQQPIIRKEEKKEKMRCKYKSNVSN